MFVVYAYETGSQLLGYRPLLEDLKVSDRLKVALCIPLSWNILSRLKVKTTHLHQLPVNHPGSQEEEDEEDVEVEMVVEVEVVVGSDFYSIHVNKMDNGNVNGWEG